MELSASSLNSPPGLSRALDILDLLRIELRPVSLDEICLRTTSSRTVANRILQTLAHRGYISRAGDGAYRIVNAPRKLRFGFASESADMPFSVAVTESLRQAADRASIDLMVLDNSYDGAIALQNAGEFIQAKVDLIVEFQIDRHVAPVIGDKIASAGIPLIAIDIPHAHATYFGVDNYRAGMDAGEMLATYANESWNQQVDWVLGLELEDAGTLVQSRMSGCLDAVRSLLPLIPLERFVRIDGHGVREKSHRIVAEFLALHPKEKHILIAGHTDTSALGALDAVRAARREHDVAIVGQDCIAEVIEEIGRPGSPMIGSVSHEAHEYGPRIIELALAILQGKSVLPYNYVNHRTISRKMIRLKSAI